MHETKNHAEVPRIEATSASPIFYLPHAPETVTWELTYDCNLSCIHCNTTNCNLIQKKALDLPGKINVIERLLQAKVFRITLSGGEPLLDPHFDIIAEKLIQSNFVDLLLTTNGVLLNTSTVKRLKKLGIARIQVSLDGAAASTHDFLRGQKGVFNQVIKNLQNLAGEFTIVVNTVVSKVNYKEMPHLLNLLKCLKVKTWRMVLLVPISKYTSDLQITSDEFKALVKWTEGKRRIEKTIKIIGPTFKFKPDLELMCLQLCNTHAAESDRLYCEAGTTLCTIMADGTVIPCTYFSAPQFHAGNIVDEPLERIWQVSPIFKIFRNLGDLPSYCKNCEIKDTCRGGCRATAYYRFGSLKAMDPRCFYS